MSSHFLIRLICRLSWAIARVGVHRLFRFAFRISVFFHSLFFTYHWISFLFLLYDITTRLPRTPPLWQYAAVICLKPGVSNSNYSEGHMRTCKVTRGPHHPRYILKHKTSINPQYNKNTGLYNWNLIHLLILMFNVDVITLLGLHFS